jgi:hypothetical protein
MFRSETISISINCPWQEVYEFLIEPLNLPTWASNMGPSIEHVSGPDWASETPNGRVIYRYPARNSLGVLDHAVFREGTKEPVITPTRVFANGDGAELTYTLFQRAGMSDEVFRSEIEWMRADFLSLKSLLESRRKRR